MRGKTLPRPFLKWAGGKAQLLKELYKYIPKEFETYYEPFVGAGALFFSLSPDKAVINDVNGDLINTYRVLSMNLKGVIELLQEYEYDQKFYYDIRSKNPLELSSIEAAARFIYLNRTCFNGVYRVNAKNEFNVPFGQYKNPIICDTQLLTLASKTLKNATLLSTDFEKCVEDAATGDFVYFDPPYVDSFTGDSKNGFNDDEHVRLAKVFDRLTEDGVKCLLSNSDTPFTRELYNDYTIISVRARRSINSNGKGRGKVGELLIKNF